MNRVFLAVAAGVVLAAGCVKEQAGMEPAGDEAGIVADAPMIIAEQSEPLTRTCIDAAADATGTLPMLWEESDEVGVFFEDGSSNAKYVNASGVVPNASFGAAAAVTGTTIKYVYYPYDAANNGMAVKALSGNVPAEQAMDGSIHGDYKWGELKSQVEEGYKFKFYNMFSLVRFNINAEGTVLAGETLESVTLTVTRNGAAVPVTGEFTFDATDGSYELGTTSSNVLKTTWNQALSGTLSSFASVFPEIKSGDQMTFVLETTNYKATLTVTSKANFESETYYTFPLTLSKLSGLTIVKKVSGTFTAATLNVDGLPDLTIVNLIFYKKTLNPDGPGADGTLKIGNLINQLQWDMVGLSEDFEHHSKLVESMGDKYSFGTHRGTITTSALTTRADTDGLGFALKDDFASANSESCVQFTSEAGDALAGANTCIEKGFRHYEVVLKTGVVFDVIVTHMNTYSDDGDHKNAQHAQLTQIANYINQISAVNKRPIIFMGDTNCRYTRHDFQQYFWNKLNSSLTVSDPWVDFHRGGTYPASGRSLMTRAKFAGDKDNDILCSDDQRGEVVDKIIYFNVEGASVTINATDCYNDVANFTKSTTNVTYSGIWTEDENGNIATGQSVSYTKNVGLADHFPVVAKFSYTGTVPLN